MSRRAPAQSVAESVGTSVSVEMAFKKDTAKTRVFESVLEDDELSNIYVPKRTARKLGIDAEDEDVRVLVTVTVID